MFNGSVESGSSGFLPRARVPVPGTSPAAPGLTEPGCEGPDSAGANGVLAGGGGAVAVALDASIGGGAVGTAGSLSPRAFGRNRFAGKGSVLLGPEPKPEVALALGRGVGGR